MRAGAIETHKDIPQEPFCVEIYRNNAGPASDHLDETPGLNSCRKNPECGHTVWGITMITKITKINNNNNNNSNNNNSSKNNNDNNHKDDNE